MERCETVTNTLNLEPFQQPSYNYGTFSSGSLIPINFTTGNSYKYCDVKINFKPSNMINVYIGANIIIVRRYRWLSLWK
jgi:hypothetical protein